MNLHNKYGANVAFLWCPVCLEPNAGAVPLGDSYEGDASKLKLMAPKVCQECKKMLEEMKGLVFLEAVEDENSDMLSTSGDYVIVNEKLWVIAYKEEVPEGRVVLVSPADLRELLERLQTVKNKERLLYAKRIRGDN